jgi:AcrR family transcriptional regulator
MFTLSTCNAMTAAKQSYHHGDLRNALVAAAVHLIESGGVDEFSLRGVARDVGVSPNAAYRHFSDKSALLTAVAQHGFERLASRMRRAMAATRTSGEPSGAAIARFKATGRAYVEFALAHPELFDVMFGRSGASQLAPAWSDDGPESPYGLLGGALDELVGRGVLHAHKRPGAELKAWATVHGFACLYLDGAAHLPSASVRAAALEELLDFAVTGICGRPH